MNSILEPPHSHPTFNLMVQGPCLASASPPTQAAGAASVRLMLKKDCTVSTALARPVYFFTRKNLYETSEKPEEYPCPKSEVFSFLTEK